MKVLLVSDQYYPLGGGIEQYLRALGQQLTDWGHQVTYLTRAVEGCPDEEVCPEGRVIRTPLLLDAIPDPKAVLDRWQQLVPLIKSIGPEVVYANHHTSLATIKACQHLEIPAVYGCHGWGLLCPLRIRLLKPDNSLCYNERSDRNCLNCRKMMSPAPQIRGLGRTLVRSTLRRLRWGYNTRKYTSAKVAQYNEFQDILESADAHIVLARAWKRFIAPDDTFAIPLGLDIDIFDGVSAGPFRQKYGVEGPYLLVASRIHNTKGQDWAIRAMPHLPEELKLVVAGNVTLFTGPKHEEDNIHVRRARQIVEELGLQDRVIFAGFLETEELVQAYSGAAVTLVPSVWLEPFGYVTVEAMACECPVVVTENCGSAEVVTDGVEGYIVPRMDPQAIAEAVLNILPCRDEMGRAAREKVVRELNWPKIAGEVLEVLEVAVESKHVVRAAGRP